MNNRDFVRHFDQLSPFTDEMMRRGIETHRKGLFAVRVLDQDGNPAAGIPVKVQLKRHEFKFGCALFLLDQFSDDKRNQLYREKFADIFNYAVMPLYWDTLEPEQGKPRFDADSPNIYRRPALDKVHAYCLENHIGIKGHCLMYNGFNPKWVPRDWRTFKKFVSKRSQEIAERYGDDMIDLDVINEMYTVYRNTYGETFRDYPICDEPGHEKWCFDTAKRYFPNTRLFWNEGCYETFGKAQYTGDKSIYYLMLKRWLAEGTPIEGIGMQFHAFSHDEAQQYAIYNPYRAMDVFRMYSEFRLPIHLSEVSIPSYSNEAEDEEVQAALVERMYRLWFSQEYVESIVWWNLVDGMAYGDENVFHAGLLRNDMSHKKAFDVLDHLIHHEWYTEETLVTDQNGRAYFNGFYGDYDVCVGDNPAEERCFHKENTGYYHITGGPREQKFTKWPERP